MEGPTEEMEAHTGLKGRELTEPVGSHGEAEEGPPHVTAEMVDAIKEEDAAREKRGCAYFDCLVCCGCSSAEQERSDPLAGVPLPGSLPDRELCRVWLKRETRHWNQRRELTVYLVFLVFFTYIALSRKGIEYARAYQSVQGVGDVVGGGEFNQGSSTDLYFEKTFDDIGEIDDLWQWLYADQSIQSLFGNSENIYQGQNKILPIIRFSQRRSTVPLTEANHITQQETGGHCPTAHELIQSDWFGVAFGTQWYCAPDYASEETRDFAWPTSPNSPGSNPIQEPGEGNTCGDRCAGKSASVGCLGMRTWYDWVITSGCTTSAATSCVSSATSGGFQDVYSQGLTRTSSGAPQRANATLQDAGVSTLRGIDDCASSYCDDCDRDVPDYLYVGCNPESTRGTNLGSAPSDNANCRHLHICLKAHFDNFTGASLANLPTTVALPTLGRCPCDYSGQSGFLYKVQGIGDFEDSIPSLGATTQDVEGRFGSYPQRGYYFDLYAEMSSDAATKVLECYEGKSWLDAYTRQFQVQFFTYNPFTDLFINHLFFVEFPPSGFVNPQRHITAFQLISWNSSAVVVCDVILFLFVAYYVVRFFADWAVDGMSLPDGSLLPERILVPLVSVWRWVEIFNLAVFLYVYVLRFTFYQTENKTLASFSDAIPGLLKANSAYKTTVGRLASDGGLFGEETIWTSRATAFDADWFEFLNIYSVTLVHTGRLEAVNAMLSFIKLFKFVSYNPWLNLLSETIKEAATDLVALLFFISVITVAFAMMGLLLYGQHVDDYSELSLAVESLLRMAIGDFDYDALLPGALRHTSARLFTIVFFFGYMGLVWLVLLNMVISIVSDAFAICKQRQKLMVGERNLGELIRDAISSQLTILMCRKKGKRYKVGIGFPRGFPQPCIRVMGRQLPLSDLEAAVSHTICASEKDIAVADVSERECDELELHDSIVIKVGVDSCWERAGVQPGMKVLAVNGHYTGMRKKAMAEHYIAGRIRKHAPDVLLRVRDPSQFGELSVMREDLERQLAKEDVCRTGNTAEPDEMTKATASMLLWYMSDGSEETPLGRTPDNRSIYAVHIARIVYQEQVQPRHVRHMYRHKYWSAGADAIDGQTSVSSTEGGGRALSLATHPHTHLPPEAQAAVNDAMRALDAARDALCHVAQLSPRRSVPGDERRASSQPYGYK
eukprot:TRINITY_DN12074_c0_g1_i1.p1 TRINITY_DN12074_c0_g1~~TRINITY_DN12074_c0_g1_i1.p1  ORF type:complete len:1193 (+),score=343.18 TRINITY_DN12074_c0_g1_i1:54-3581(+)